MNWRYWIKITFIVIVFIALGFIGAIYLFSDKESAAPLNKVEEAVIPVNKATTTVEVKKEVVEKPKLESFKLNVPYYHQQYLNSCEASSLRMALGYYGIKATDMELVNAFGYSPRSKDVENNTWDDPQVMFVGFVDLASSTGGYGVYGKPVARVAEQYGRTAVYKTSVTPQELAGEIKAGHPVIMWGYSSLKYAPYTWNIVGGGTVPAFHGEHVRAIVGVYGDPKAPTGFFVHDPMVGPYVYWPTATLMKQFNSVPGVTNQIVVVK